MNEITSNLFDLICNPIENEEEKKDRLKVIELFLKHSKDYQEYGFEKLVVKFDVTDKNKYTLLSSAAAIGWLDVVKLLIDAGAEPNPQKTPHPPLAVAAKHNQAEMVEFLLDIGANPNYVYDKHTPSANPLVAACEHQSDKSMKMLLLYNAEELEFVERTRRNAPSGWPGEYEFRDVRKTASSYLVKDNEKTKQMRTMLKANQLLREGIKNLESSEGANIFQAQANFSSALAIDPAYVLAYMTKIAQAANLRGQGCEHFENNYHPHVLRWFIKSTKANIKMINDFVPLHFVKEEFKQLLEQLNAYDPTSEFFGEGELVFQTIEEKAKTLRWLESHSDLAKTKSLFADKNPSFFSTVQTPTIAEEAGVTVEVATPAETKATIEEVTPAEALATTVEPVTPAEAETAELVNIFS